MTYFEKRGKQMVDNSCDLLYPWYERSFLKDWLAKQDVSNWEVFEWGGGASTLWWAKNAKHVDTLETDEKWTKDVKTGLNHYNLSNFSIDCIYVDNKDAPFGSQNKPTENMERYLNYIGGLNKRYDCIVIDGSYRDNAILVSEKYLRPEGHLIFDNYLQNSSGYLTLEYQWVLDERFEKIHTGTDGPWKTVVWKKLGETK